MSFSLRTELVISDVFQWKEQTEEEALFSASSDESRLLRRFSSEFIQSLREEVAVQTGTNLGAKLAQVSCDRDLRGLFRVIKRFPHSRQRLSKVGRVDILEFRKQL